MNAQEVLNKYLKFQGPSFTQVWLSQKRVKKCHFKNSQNWPFCDSLFQWTQTWTFHFYGFRVPYGMNRTVWVSRFLVYPLWWTLFLFVIVWTQPGNPVLSDFVGIMHWENSALIGQFCEFWKWHFFQSFCDNSDLGTPRTLKLWVLVRNILGINPAKFHCAAWNS